MCRHRNAVLLVGTVWTTPEAVSQLHGRQAAAHCRNGTVPWHNIVLDYGP
jgi:hypothetical protein